MSFTSAIRAHYKRKRLFTLLLVLLIFGIAFLGHRSRPSVSHAAIVALAGRIRALEPPLAADLLIRLAYYTSRSDLATKQTLLNDAYVIANKAQYSALPRDLQTSGAVESRRNMMAFGMASLGLDRLTLQTRALVAISENAPQAAVQLLRTISIPPASGLGCKDRWASDDSPYYDAVPTVLSRAGQPLEALNCPLTLHCAGQIAPVGEVLASQHGHCPSLARTTSQFAQELETLPADDCTFRAAVVYHRLVPSLLTLINECTKCKIDAAPVLRGFRNVLGL